MHHIILPLDHSVLIQLSKNTFTLTLKEEVKQWLLGNIGARREDRLTPWNDTLWFDMDGLTHYEVIFKYRKAAMLFKLTWV